LRKTYIKKIENFDTRAQDCSAMQTYAWNRRVTAYFTMNK